MTDDEREKKHLNLLTGEFMNSEQKEKFGKAVTEYQTHVNDVLQGKEVNLHSFGRFYYYDEIRKMEWEDYLKCSETLVKRLSNKQWYLK